MVVVVELEYPPSAVTVMANRTRDAVEGQLNTMPANALAPGANVPTLAGSAVSTAMVPVPLTIVGTIDVIVAFVALPSPELIRFTPTVTFPLESML
jgi:hypothetical protein